MIITYTGKQEYLHPTQKTSLETKFAKIGKLLDVDGKGDRRAHVILHHQKNDHRVEITLNFLDHQIAGEHVDPDQFTALNAAVDKIEKQMIKVRDKRRDIKKGPREDWDKSASVDKLSADDERDHPLPAVSLNGKPKVYRVAPADGKPMTIDEAMMEIDSDNYLVYRDATSNSLSVLLRRDDGNFDLVEC